MRCLADRRSACGWICFLGSRTNNLSVDTSRLLVIFPIITPHDYMKSPWCVISPLFSQTIKLLYIFRKPDGTPGTWALLAIRIAELSQSLLFELSPPPLSSRPLTRLILQTNWPWGWRAVFTSGPLGAGWTGREEGVLRLPHHQRRLMAWTASPYNCPPQRLVRTQALASR